MKRAVDKDTGAKLGFPELVINANLMLFLSLGGKLLILVLLEEILLRYHLLLLCITSYLSPKFGIDFVVRSAKGFKAMRRLLVKQLLKWHIWMRSFMKVLLSSKAI